MSESPSNYNLENEYTAEVIADSVSEFGDRLTTIEVNFPRMILAEFNTHRLFSRNSASSRAIPTHKRLSSILDQPFIPLEWGKYMSGMSSREQLSPDNQARAEQIWLHLRTMTVLGTVALLGGVENEELRDKAIRKRIETLNEEYGFDVEPLDGEALHKQWVNRPLEPFMWHKVIVTATEWENFYALRISEHAQPEIKLTAERMLDAYESSTPKEVKSGEWHTPYIRESETGLEPDAKLKVSSARSARVSYETHRGERDLQADINLHDSLTANGHMSPLEHVATPFTAKDMDKVRKIEEGDFEEWQKKQARFHGNFRGWHQYRKSLPNEDNYRRVINDN